jgi:hypothetical protein
MKQASLRALRLFFAIFAVKDFNRKVRKEIREAREVGLEFACLAR